MVMHVTLDTRLPLFSCVREKNRDEAKSTLVHHYMYSSQYWYRIFLLLSTCAYIPTGRKPALNSKVHLTARLQIAMSMYTCASVVLNKGAWPNAQSYNHSR